MSSIVLIVCGIINSQAPAKRNDYYTEQSPISSLTDSSTSENNKEKLVKNNPVSPTSVIVKENFIFSKVSKAVQNDIPSLPEELEIVTPNGVGYNITGVNIKQATLVSIPYVPAKIPTGYLISDIRTFRFDYKIEKWEELEKEGIDPDKNLLYSRTHADGLMINGIIKSPELPQTDNYTPTRIKDLKLADPGANVQLIEPPVANQQGTARLSYNIEVPKGRNGIEPDLKVTYSSDGGNGLLGEGWNLHIPTISVETRWGVPNYNPTIESETYLLDGEMLAFERSSGTTVAHRTLNVPRNTTGIRQFYKRKQTDYNTIIRHGSNPNDYWWEIIDSKGTKFYYGRKKERKSGAGRSRYDLKESQNSLLKDTRGNVAEWKLTWVEDVFGNCMSYSYGEAKENIGHLKIANNYIDSIEYTGWQKEGENDYQAFNYIVVFNWLRNPAFSYTARTGLLTGSIRLINEITVALKETFDKSKFKTGKRVRSYKFDYDFNNPFSKPLLTKLTQFGTDGTTEFYHHDFKYYNDLTNGLFSHKPWESFNESLQDGVIPNGIIPNTEPTDLGGSKSNGNGFSFYAGLGVNDWQICNKSVTVGVQFGFNNSQSEGLNTIIDIDGDGLPDKVFVIGDKLLFRKNTGNGFSRHEQTIAGRSQFFEESSTTNSFGVSAYFGASVSRDKSTTVTDITTYFSDVNADGLIDIVCDGHVYFNRIINGIPTFNVNSNETPLPITGGAISVSDPVDYVKKRNSLALENPQHDLVRVWEAPFSGMVSINAPVKLLRPIFHTRRDSVKFIKADGVALTIQKGSTQLWTQSISKDNYELFNPDISSQSVTKGDKIYFRVMSGLTNLSNGDFDVVNWIPEITYTEDNGETVDLLKKKRSDVFGQSMYEYKITSDFLFTNEAGIYPDADRVVNIRMPFQKEITSDDVRVQIIQLAENLHDPIIRNGRQVEQDWMSDGGTIQKRKLFHFSKQKILFDTLLNAGSKYSSLCPQDLLSTQFYKDSIYLFQILSDVNTEFKKVRWEPYIYFYNEDRKVNDTIFVIPNYQLRTQQRERGAFWEIPTTKSYSILPYIKFKNSSVATDSIWFTIRKDSTIIEKYKLKYNQGSLSNYLPDTLNLKIGDEYFATFEADAAFDGNIEECNWIAMNFLKFDGSIENQGGTYFKTTLGGKFILTHNLTFKSDQNQIVKYSILKNGAIISTGKIKYNNVKVVQANDTIALKAGDGVTVKYENIKTAPGIPPISIVDSARIEVSQQLNADLWYKRTDDKFGPMYRNWGQFAYNDVKNGAINVIEESKLHEPNISANQGEAIKSNITNQTNNTSSTDAPVINDTNVNKLNKKNAEFNTLVPFRTSTEYQWKGMDDEIHINQKFQSASRVGLKEINIESPFKTTSTAAGTASGIIKRSSSDNVSITAGAGLGISKSSGNSRIESDYMDLNGDRFPDIISTSNAQLTKPDGTLGGVIDSVILNQSANSSNGIQIGGSSFPSFSGNSSNNSRTTGSSIVNTAQNGSGSATASNQAALNIGASGVAASGADFSKVTWLDVNGDGLPDKLSEGGSVELNLGYSFANAIVLPDLPYITKGSNVSVSPSLNLGYNNGNSSISGGMGVSLARSLPENMLQDINGDGLIDKIELSGNNATFYINKGATSFQPPLASNDLLNQGAELLNLPTTKFANEKWKTSFSSSAGNSLGGSFTYGFVFGPIYPIFKVVFTPGINHSRGLGTTLRQFYDINGDGYPDYLFSEKEGELEVRLSNIARTNKLQSVSRPLDGSFEIDYKHNVATYDHPGGKWVMDSLTVYDGVKEDRLVDKGFDSKQSFEYKNGRYDRYEREFLGFEEVITNDLDFKSKTIRKHIRSFDNNNYYTASNLLSDRIEDGNRKIYVETVNRYWHFPNAIGDLKIQGEDNPDIQNFDPRLVYSTPLKQSRNFIYEGTPTSIILNESYYEYDELGNNVLFRYSNEGKLFKSNFQAFDYETVKTYEPIYANKIFGLLKEYVVRNKSYDLRKGSALYNKINGSLETEITQLNGKENSSIHYTYDPFGNIEKKVFSDGFWIAYAYEAQTKSFIEKVTDKRNILIGSRFDLYDLRFGIPLLLTDINRNVTKYQIDALFGRTTKVWSPMEFKDGITNYDSLLATIEIIYDANLNMLGHSKVIHRTNQDPGEQIITHTYIDGNKKIIQTKKNAVISDPQGQLDREHNWIASGKNVYDALGRVVKEYYPAKDNKEGYDITLVPNVITPSEFTYDILNRKLSIKLPLTNNQQPHANNSYAKFEYGLAGNSHFQKDIIYNDDASLNKVSVAYYNGNGDKIKTEQLYKTLSFTTEFEYDEIHQLISVKDNKGNLTKYGYDYKGRVITKSSPDAGQYEFKYDLLDNKIVEILPSGKAIRFKYEHERLTEIHYPDNQQNDVRYVYGDDNVEFRNGRLYYKQDATGAEEYSYDRMGNITLIKKSIIAPFDTTYTFETKFSFDSWNRIRSISYPDDDKVEYKYNEAGLLETVRSSKGNYNYIEDIGYDEFENRCYIKYGNNTSASYAYDDRRRMRILNTSFVGGGASIITYNYDNQNNIIGYTNNSNPGNGLRNDNISHEYKYNSLAQLIEASGDVGVNSYKVSYGYDDRFNLIQNKDSLVSSIPAVTHKKEWKYDISQSNNQLVGVFEKSSRTLSDPKLDPYYKEENTRTYEYDDRGNNIRQIKSDSKTKRYGVNEREIIYDEENRVSAVSLNGFVSNNFYNDKGDRIVKLSTQTDNVFVNGELSNEKISSTTFSLYVNAYYSTRNGGNLYTKSIYIGNERIASELSNLNYKSEAQCQVPICKSCEKIPPLVYQAKRDSLDKFINSIYDEFDLPHAAIDSNAFTARLPLRYGSEITPSQNNVGEPIDTEVGLRYFYHTNQINSVNYVSDNTGQVVQQIEYLPYGQIFVEQRRGYSSQFTFSGKEEDRESGLTYFGARYYNPVSSLWLSVDPQADKFPGLSPYNYCLGNPVVMKDEDGTIPFSLYGFQAVNKSDLAGAPNNSVVRTSTYLEERNVGTSPHVGIDYRAPIGSDIYSLGEGTVENIGSFKNGIRYLSVKYKDGDVFRFLHLSSTNDELVKGSKVYEGQIIGKTGNSGTYFDKKTNSFKNYPAHLHVDALNKFGMKINPENKNYGDLNAKEFFNDPTLDTKNKQCNDIFSQQ